MRVSKFVVHEGQIESRGELLPNGADVTLKQRAERVVNRLLAGRREKTVRLHNGRTVVVGLGLIVAALEAGGWYHSPPFPGDVASFSGSFKDVHNKICFHLIAPQGSAYYVLTMNDDPPDQTLLLGMMGGTLALSGRGVDEQTMAEVVEAHSEIVESRPSVTRMGVLSGRASEFGDHIALALFESQYGIDPD